MIISASNSRENDKGHTKKSIHQRRKGRTERYS
jgi:hypothetical protein